MVRWKNERHMSSSSSAGRRVSGRESRIPGETYVACMRVQHQLQLHQLLHSSQVAASSCGEASQVHGYRKRDVPKLGIPIVLHFPISICQQFD